MKRRSPRGLPEPYQMRDGRWRVAVQLGSGSREHRRRVFLSGSSAVEVRRRRDEWLQAQAQGRRPHDQRLSTGTFLRRWLDSLTVRERTRESYQATIQRHVLPYVGGVPLAQLGPLDIDEMHAAQARKGVPAATRRYSGTLLRAALNVAVRKRLIPYNPSLGADKVAVTPRRPTLLTTEQARILLAGVAADRLGPLFTLLATTGLRRGEALAVVWSDWDREKATLAIEKTLLYRPGEGFQRAELKTSRSRRILALPALATTALREQSRRQAEERLRAGRQWRDAGLVFTGERRPGGALSGATVVHALHRLCANNGLPRIRVHDLRHLMATAMAEAGVPEAVRMAVLGHTSPSMTSRYTHAAATAKSAAEAIDDAFGRRVDAAVDAIVGT
jgi:integrase